MLLAGVSGTAPMSMRMFVVACWIRAVGLAVAAGVQRQAPGQWLVPVVTTSAPLGAVYFAMCDIAEPGA